MSSNYKGLTPVAPTSGRRHVKAVFQAVAVLALLAGCAKSGAGPQTVEGMSPVGTVEMHQVQAAYIGSASGGAGTLFFNGQSYPFDIGGVGIGGIGASKIEATGDVYGLQTVPQFAGSYAQGRYGYALGDLSGGDMWLKNENGVVLHLRAKRQGLMLSLGGDVMVIKFSQ
jgi:hypothetical protein